jgi:N-acetylglucosaminyldiphosphoundecaprenol N-acetyl-beta-D-mannosaminyltransferase
MDKTDEFGKATDADGVYEAAGTDAGEALEALPTLDVFGSRVDAINYPQLFKCIDAWTRRPEARRICLAGIPSIIFSRDDPEYREAHGSSDLVLPDGMPLVWHLRRAGHRSQERMDGPNLVYRLCAYAERHAIPVGFYGSTVDTVGRIERNIRERYPKLDLRLCRDAPFLPAGEKEELQDVAEINRSGARIVFVGLSCPKQELWMGRHRDRLLATTVGVGGAFDVVAGSYDLPPMWVQQSGLQWLYRLMQEPRRLWRRYLVQNSRYLGLVLWSRLGGNTQLR